MLLLLATLAHADDGWIDLDADDDLPSATAPEDEGPRYRSRFAPRPWLGVVGFDGRVAVAAGGQLSHQWWSLADATVRPAGEATLRVDAPFLGVRGWQVHLDATAGAWFGPVALQAGFAARGDQLRHGDVLVPAGLALGPEARVAATAGVVTPWGAVAPMWAVAGDRSAALDLEVKGGVVIDVVPLGVRLQGAWRSLGGTPTWEAVLGFHYRVL